MGIPRKTFVAVLIFNIAMAALEGAVVVYLRALYYPDGFTVAMKMTDQRILMIEIVRELATVIMLAGVGYLAGKSLKDRFAYFLMSFAVWDIFYYVWLKIFIDWPSSILEWDILFLIPFTWLGPTLAPIICSATMLLLAISILQTRTKLTLTSWCCFAIGSSIILYTFLEDYGSIIISNGFYLDYAALLQNKDFLNVASHYIPQSYSWNLFTVGELLIIAGIYLIRMNSSATGSR